MVLYYCATRNMDKKQQNIDASNNLKNIWNKYKKHKKITQKEFASKIGISQGNFSQYLTGKASLGMDMILKMSAELRCEPCDIRKELRTEKTNELLNKMYIELNEANNILTYFSKKNKTINKKSELLLKEIQETIHQFNNKN